MRSRRPLLCVAVLVVAMAGCSSPEATRARAGGPGADGGNRGEVVRMHGGSEPYHGTPRLIGMDGAASGSAAQAKAAEGAIR